MNLNESKALKDIAKALNESDTKKDANYKVSIVYYPLTGLKIDYNEEEYEVISEYELRRNLYNDFGRDLGEDKFEEMFNVVKNGGSCEFNREHHRITVSVKVNGYESGKKLNIELPRKIIKNNQISSAITDDVDLGNGWVLIKPEIGDGVGNDMYYFVAIEGITCKYADQKLYDSFYDFCNDNDINPDDISIIGINSTKGAVGTYCNGGKKGGVDWKSAVKSAKIFIEKYKTVKKWMDENGMKTNNKKLVVYAVDYSVHNF